jgi:hypothetical protein
MLSNVVRLDALHRAEILRPLANRPLPKTLQTVGLKADRFFVAGPQLMPTMKLQRLVSVPESRQKYVLGDIQTNRSNLHLDGSLM